MTDNARPWWTKYPAEGSVTNRNDPEGRGRIKAIIPGCIEPETPWLEPIGVEGGTANRGSYNPPAVGANVTVMWILGDPTKGRYVAGPWGAPNGVSDAPTNSAVDGDNLQNAVIEDEEWRIERDSRSGSAKLSLFHRGTGLEIVIDGVDEKLYLTTDGATEALVLGTSYRTDEATFLNGFWAAMFAMAQALGASANIAAVNAAGNAAKAAMDIVGGTDIKDDASAYLSDEAFTE